MSTGARDGEIVERATEVDDLKRRISELEAASRPRQKKKSGKGKAKLRRKS